LVERKKRVHYYSPEYLPSRIDPATYNMFLKRGLTPPNALPIHIPDDTPDRINRFLELNYFKLSNGGVQYLGNEFNIQPPSAWDKAKVRVCMVRLSDYHTLDGAFGGFLVNNFIQDFSDDIFIDFAWFPQPADISRLYDAELPLLFANGTKRPLTDFDIVIIALSYPGERVNLPLMVKAGLPLYRWQRWSHDLPYRAKCPIIALAGIGSSFIENMLGDNPRHGIAGNAAADFVLIGEGEMMDLKFIQQYQYTVIEDGGTKEDFRKALTNKLHEGVYDPSLFLFEYADKVHTKRDHTGKVLSEEVYEGAGPIKGIYLIDEENKRKYCMVGPESEEFQQMELINQQFHLRMPTDPDAAADFGRSFVKVSDKPDRATRKAAGVLAEETSPGKKTLIDKRGD
jgi:hypothetical protein